MKKPLSRAAGQGLVEFAIVLPLVLVLALGVFEIGYVELDQHVVTKLAREGSNLISRDTTLLDAGTAMRNMSTRPVNFNSANSKVIFSVIKRGATVGTTNFNQNILYQRYEVGGLSATSVLSTRGGGSFGGPPDYQASNSDTNANLQVTNLPPNLLVVTGGMIYVTEIYTNHTVITPFDRLGIAVPRTLYSIAYF